MKKSFIAVAALFTLSIAPGVASADVTIGNLTFNNTTSSSCTGPCSGTITQTFNGALMGLPSDISSGSFLLGELDSAGVPGTITFTYIGHESGFTNQFALMINGVQTFTTDGSTAAGAFYSNSLASSGAIDFKFASIGGGGSGSAINGGTWTAGDSIGLVGTNQTVTGASNADGTYAFVLGFNDNGGTGNLNDWDDLVVGVNFVSAIPEPEIYAMMGIGLTLMGFVARRRKL